MKFKILLFFLLSYCSFIQLSGQVSTDQNRNDKNKIDSLWNTFKQVKHDTTRIQLYLYIGDFYEYEIPDTALFYYQKAVKLASKALARPFTTSQHKIGKVSSKTTSVLSLLKAKSFLYIGNIYNDQSSYDKAIEYYLKSLKIYEELKDKKGIAICYNDIGIVHRNQGNYDKAIGYFLKSLEIYEGLRDKNGISACYINIGNVHSYQGSYDKAIEYYLKALKIKEELGDKNGMSQCYNNIGVIHYDQSSYNKAIEYYLKTLKIKEELGDKKGIAISYNNIGLVHSDQSSYDKAIRYFLKSLEIYEGLRDKNGMSTCYDNIGVVYKNQGNYDKAIKYFLKSLKIDKELGNKNGIANIYVNISNLHITLADSTSAESVGDSWGNRRARAHLDTALVYGNKAYKLAVGTGAVPMQNDVAAILQKVYTKLGRYRDAIKYAEIFIETQDSMFSEEKTKALAEMGTKYEAEKKQLQIDNLNKENALKKSELAQSEEKRNKQLILIWSFVAGFIIILVFSVVILRLFMQKKKANLILARQKQQIEIQNSRLQQANEEISTQRDEIAAQRDLVTEQKEHIEEQKKEIDDSINYAKRIQTAVLPTDKYADDILGEHFIIFRPHSVVSGDFYWATKTDDWTIVTVADCTGHGVPGAFMSMLGVSFLNEIVRKKEVINAAEILNHLRTSIIDALKQTGEEGTQKDGMDMSIVVIHKDKNHGVWAGANNPLWIIRQNAINKEFEDKSDIVEEYKADKMPVAVHVNMKLFTNHEIQFETGDRIYLFSDGLKDQFGGEKGKKFLAKRFKRILAETSFSPYVETMKKQGIQIEKELDKWMNFNGKKYEQVDDITVIGLKI